LKEEATVTTGSCTIKLFAVVTYSVPYEDKVFVTFSLFRPRLIIVVKAGAYHMIAPNDNTL
jgi:hypothetical protein